MNKRILALPALLVGTAVSGAETVWTAENPSDWGIKNSAPLQSSQRLISAKSFKVDPDKKYTLSGEFRLTGAENPRPFYFGFMPMTAEGRRIEAANLRQVPKTDLAEMAESAAQGTTEVILKKAPSWPTSKRNLLIAFNAKEDGADLPNFSIVQTKSIRHSGDRTIVTLASPLRTGYKAGTPVRLQAYGNSFLYTAAGGRKKLSGEWQKFTGTIQFDSGREPWYRGTAQAKVIVLPSAAKGTLEFRNVSVTAEKADSVFVREGEADTVRQGAVITVSDSAESAQYRPGSMYDGKKDTAWLTGGAQSEHDIDIHWFCRNMNVSGIMIDFTPVEFKYRYQYSYLSYLNGFNGPSYQGTSGLPEKITLDIKQDGKWHTMGNYPVKGKVFHLRFAKPEKDIQRLRISFAADPEHRVAIREIMLPGTPTGNAVNSIPSFSAAGSVYIWPTETLNDMPHTKPVQAFFRTLFAVKPGKKPVEAVLTAAAYNQAVFYLNGKKLLETPPLPLMAKPKAARIRIPGSELKKDNLLAFHAEKLDTAGGLIGVIFQLVVKYDDGSKQTIVSNAKTTVCASEESTGWKTALKGFEDWKPVRGRYLSGAYPSGGYWAVDFSEPCCDDEVELTACRLIPAVPKCGEKYRLELDFDIAEPLKHDYDITARYGWLPNHITDNFMLGTAVTRPGEGLCKGDRGKKQCVITGTWIEEVSPTLPVRLAVSNAKQQAFIRSKLGQMTTGAVEGQLDLRLGAKMPVLPPGFPKAELRNGRFHIDGKPAGAFFYSDNNLTAGKVADQLDSQALQMVRVGPTGSYVIAGAKKRKSFHDHYIACFEECAEYALSKNPDTKFMLVIPLDPDPEWLFEHPDEQIELGDGSRLMGLYNNRGKGTLQVRASMGSQAYRKLIRENLTELFTRLKEHRYAHSVAAVAFAAGLAYENNWGVDRYDFTKGPRRRDNSLAGDFGPASRVSLVRFLKKRYGSDEKWAAAWKLPKDAKLDELLSLAAWPQERIQKIMLWKDRPADRFIFRDGRLEGRAAEDLNEFSSLQRSLTLLEAAGAIKKVSDKSLIIGSYAGYVFPQLTNNPTGSSVYSGHAAAKILRESPDFDFFSSPQWCHTLDLPVFYSVLNDSLQLYGKIYIAEGDIRTHSAAFGSLYSRKSMVSQLRKIAGLMLAKNFGGWFLGWSYSVAGPKGVRFFSDPAILTELKNLRECSVLPPVEQPDPDSRIALLVSEQSSWFMDLMSPANTVHAMLTYKNLHKFLRTGAGCDIMALEDLPQLVRTGKLKQYRFVAFYNAFHLDAELRKLINSKVKSEGRMVLFFYAPGFHDDSFNLKKSSVSPEGIADLLGVSKVDMLREAHLIGAHWKNAGDSDISIWWDKGQTSLFTNEIGPVFWLSDGSNLEKLAHLRIDGKNQPDKIAAAKIKGKNHTVVYVAVPDIPQDVLNRLVRESGTRISADGSVIVNIGRGFLTVTNSGDAREITLKAPYKANWIELPENRQKASAVTELTLPFEKEETRLFRLIPCAD